MEIYHMGKNDNKISDDEIDKLNEDEIVDVEPDEITEEKMIELPESEYLDLLKKIDEHKKSAKENFEKLKRAQADFENYKKILDKDKQEFVKYAEKGIILDILSLIDEFEIALNAVRKEIEDNEKLKGIKVIYNKFIEFLNKMGVKPIKAIGEPFDPFLHEALLSEKTDEYPEDTILQEIKKGYYLKDKVLRPALVKISKNK